MKTTIGRRLLLLLLTLAGCATRAGAGREGLDVNQLPLEVRDDYNLFARRCSKCHPLSRALNSGIDQDDTWATYVARMRRQPGSGISQDDATRILRFLHYYALEEQRRKREREAQAGAPAPRTP
jgi:hypothetical protein